MTATSNQTFKILLISLALMGPSNTVLAGNGTCESAQSGPWNDPNTWINCANGSGIPEMDNFVIIKTGHEVVLNVDTGTINDLNLEANAVLRVANSVGGHTITTNEGGYDFSLGSVVLEGDLTLNDNNADGINLGPVDGGFTLILNSSGQVTVNAPLGGADPLASITSDVNGGINIGASITTTGFQFINDVVTVWADVTLSASSVSIFGTVDADVLDVTRNFSVNSTTASQFNSAIGSSTPLQSLTVQTGSFLVVEGDVTTTADQTFDTQVYIRSATAFTGAVVNFNGEVFSESVSDAGFDLTVNGNANFTTDIGSTNPPASGLVNLNSMAVTGHADFTAVGNGADIITDGSQTYSSSLSIGSDASFTSLDNANIDMRNSGGMHHLTLNTSGTTFLRGTIGSPRHASITTDAGGNVRLGGQVFIQVDGSNPTTFNDSLSIGASGRITIDQAGSGDLIFNGPISRLSGSPHELTINDVSGRTVFNNTILIGELTTNDGAGDDVTVINTNSVTTQQGGADNGFMRFFDPVEVSQSVTFSETNSGRIQFFNSVNESLAVGAVDIAINSDAEVWLGPVGNLNSPSSLTSDSGGTVAINGDVFVNANLTFNDSVIMNGDYTLSGEDVFFNDTVDLQTHDLTLFALGAEANGVISGSGDLISDVFSNLYLNAENTYTGQTLINNGLLNLSSAPSANNISTSSEIRLSEFGVLVPETLGGVFALADGQILSGAGNVFSTLHTSNNSQLSPGFSPGILTINALEMFTGSQLQVEIDGVVAGTDYDQVSSNSVNLDSDSTGGALLDVTLNASISVTDEFIIIDNTGANPITNTFNGLAEGAYVTASNGQNLAISYVGGDGNDVVLSGACTADITVTDGADSGVGTLRQAVADVCAGGVIHFATDMTVNLTSSIDINKDMTINGGGANVTISGGNSTLLMAIFLGADVNISQVNLNNGSAGKGSGALYVEGQLSLNSTTLNNNVGNEGGAIYVVSGGDLVIENSTLVGNSADHGGAIYNLGSATIINSTFTNNGTSGTIEGGAIHNQGTLVSTNNTLANNGTGSTSGAAVFTQNGSHELINTLIADNNAAGCFIDLGNSIEKNSSSLIESGNCDADFTADPQLQTLADNGGDTLTMALALTSPAVDSANITFCPLTDQRGVDRPQLEGCDIGAYETEYLPIVYVDRDNTTRSGICIPGACWANAYEHLSDALAVAGPTSQVWVADGVYYPDRGAGVINDDPQGSFDITSGVLLYGGFNGTETALNQRDVNANITILSGDIDQNDTDDDGNQVAELVADINGTNAYNVLSINGTGVIIDGFTITAGYADGGTASEQSGGGLRCLQAESMTHVLANNSWMGNYAASNGGAIHVCGGLVLDSFFGGNSSDANGGAIFSSNNVLIENTGFYANQANFSGGAVFAASTTIDRVVFSGNQVNLFGGALFINGDIDISNSLFSGNYSNDSGGAVITFNNTHFTNVTMTGNQAFVAGGAVFIPDAPNRPTGGAEFTFSNSIIWNNQDATGPGTLSAGVTSTDSVSFAHSIFQGSGGSTSWNPGAGIDAGDNIDLDPEFVLDVDLMAVPTITGNTRLTLGSAAIGTGDNAAVSRPLDLDNNPRIDGSVVDMGAYEYGDLIFANGFE